MSQHFVTTAAIPAICRHCRALTLTGHAEGIRATVDPVSLSTTGRAAAILDRRTTYALTAGELVERTLWRQTHPVAPTVAEHRCGQPIPAHWQAPPAPAHRYVTPDQPAY